MVTAKYAKFSAQGTHSLSSSSGEDFHAFHGHTAHLYRTDFRYGNYRWKCELPGNPGGYKLIWGAWQVQANDYGGGATTRKQHTSPDAKYCVPQQAKSTFHKRTSEAYTFAAGVSISDTIGIDLSAQTGYDRQAQFAYHVGSVARLTCGRKGPPGGNSPAPQLIVAGAK